MPGTSRGSGAPRPLRYTNSIEKQLARMLLLARYGVADQPQAVLPKLSQETLAEMVGTTRSRVTSS